MPNIARIIGGAGTGKTTALLRKMEAALQAGGYDPFQVGFVSFTRGARQVAAERAGAQFGCDPHQLQHDGWFRTLHSVCYRQLGCKSGDVLADSADDLRWMREHVDAEVGGTGEPGEDFDRPTRQASGADRVLAIWHCARARLVPLSQVHAESVRVEDRTPSYAHCEAIVTRYEQAKRLDGRQDFTDILGRFAGWSFSPSGGPTAVRPDGDVPDVPVWFLDEQQDASALLDSVCRRLTASARWVYVVGDPFQSVYGFAGADPRHFMAWRAGKEETLRQSYRCPAPVVALGEQVLRGCTDYWDRGIRPSGHEGRVDQEIYKAPWPHEMDLGESWLLLARTNFLANRLAARLKGADVPWLPTKGVGSKWGPTIGNRACRALTGLETDRGYVVNVNEWQAVLKSVEAKGLFVRGTKARWKDYRGDPDALSDLAGLREWGATELFQTAVRSGRWRGWLANGADYANAWKWHGWQAVTEPRVRVGTVHSAKGAEADNVVLLTTLTEQSRRSMYESRRGLDEELRLQYVAVTRARKRLLVVRETGQPNEMGLGYD